TDQAGNSLASTQWSFTTEAPADTAAPTIQAPADITTETTGDHTPVELGTPTVSDNVDPSPTVTNDAPSDGFPVGTTKVTWTATDASGNSASDTQTVTITEKKDTTAPTITDKSPSDGSTNVKVTTSVTATFSEDVKGLDGSSFKLKDGTNSIA